jgi:hypothetical protein
VTNVSGVYVGPYVDGRDGGVLYIPGEVAHLTSEQLRKLQAELERITNREARR